MGVAFGTFSPSKHYDPDAHANTIEGEYVEDRGKSLIANDDQYSMLETASIAIEDYGDLGKQLTLLFGDGRKFAAIFDTHPDYRAYYPPQ